MLKTTFLIVLGLQVLLYLWLGWVYFFAKEGHVPVPYIVAHIVAGINLALAVAGLIVYAVVKSRTPLILWTVVAATPSFLIVAYLYLLRFLPPRS